MGISVPVVPVGSSIRELIEVIDKYQLGVSFVVDSTGRVIGSATDGDVRRALISGHNLDVRVESIMNKHFISVTSGTPYPTAYALAQKTGVSVLPLLSSDGTLADVFLFAAKKTVRTTGPSVGVVMAGGRGTRMGSLTSHTPKPLLHVCGVPLIDYAISSLVRTGVQQIVVSVNHMAEKIQNYVGDGSRYGTEVVFLEEEDPRGTAGALADLELPDNHPFILANADVLHDFDLNAVYDFHRRWDSKLTICAKERHTSIPYGVLEVDNNRLMSLTEKPEKVILVSSGVYVVSPSSLRSIPKGSETDITEVAQQLLRNRGSVHVYQAEQYWRDVGTPEALRLANEELSSTQH